MAATLLELQRIDKRFPGTHALREVSLTFQQGETHAIIGENGAGKSTLIKILTGAYRKDQGQMRWLGHEVDLRSPLEAQALGINAVHQEVALAPDLTVAENIFLGDEPCRFGMVNYRKMYRQAAALLEDLGFDLPVRRRLGDLSIGRQQLVATARASARGTRLLIFDEPTAYLSNTDAERLFSLIRRLQREGVTIIYISHRLEEVFELANRVTVLRDGAVVSTQAVEQSSRGQLIQDMAGRSFEQLYYKETVAKGALLLRSQGLSGKGFEDINLSVHRGEIVGLFGLVGAGRSEFLHAVFGRSPAQQGHLQMHGQSFTPRNVNQALSQGIALIPESRRMQGLCLSLSVGFNLNLPAYRKVSTLGMVQSGRERHVAKQYIDDLSIRTPSAGRTVSKLSGGNQQKVVVGKWLNHGADLYIFDEPTTGVDVSTKLEIYKLFAALLRQGAGIILVSSYLPEVLELSDVLHIFRKGRCVASYPYETLDESAARTKQQAILAHALGA